jgi:hypothetical protein
LQIFSKYCITVPLSSVSCDGYTLTYRLDRSSLDMEDNDRADTLGMNTITSRFTPLVPDREAAIDPLDTTTASHQLQGETTQENRDSNAHRQTNRPRPISPAEQREDLILPLNARDVGAFIVNKMIGTGIFIQPPAVLLLTQSKVEALSLWLLGFLYTLIA